MIPIAWKCQSYDNEWRIMNKDNRLKIAEYING